MDRVFVHEGALLFLPLRALSRFRKGFNGANNMRAHPVKIGRDLRIAFVA